MSTPTKPPQECIDAAIGASLKADCRSHRGIVVWNADGIVSVGWNGPPKTRACTKDAVCKATCSRFAIHAEFRAVWQAGAAANGAEMLHVKTVDGQLVVSGGPSCPQCSKMLVEVGVAGMWLYRENGWQRYDVAEFDRLTIEHCLAFGGHAD
jgi:deoxycytidylate deaminase